MALTVGIVRELNFISKALKTPVNVVIYTEICGPIHIYIENELLEVKYTDKLIWKESLGDDSFFGLESCDVISRIISCIDNGAPWDKYKWSEAS